MTKRTALLLPLVLLVGCLDPGERAQSGGCPPGEVCNPSTPRGLYFGGATLSDCLLCDPGIKATAVGGTQTIIVHDADGGLFTRTFDAEAWGPGFSITEVAPPDVVVQAETASWTELSIVDTQGRLYDKIDIRAVDLAEVELIPSPFQAAGVGVDDTWVLWNNGGSVVARLSGNGQRLVDESMQLAMTGDADQPRWDRLTTRGASAGDHTVTISRGETSYEFPVRVVDEVTDLSLFEGMGSDPVEPFPANQAQTFCFRAHNGSDIIVGARFEFRLTGNAELEESFLNGCVYVTGTEPGAVVLDVKAGDFSYPFAMTVTEAETATARQRADLPAPSAIVPVPGVRALGR